jgi:hypothetical protein
LGTLGAALGQRGVQINVRVEVFVIRGVSKICRGPDRGREVVPVGLFSLVHERAFPLVRGRRGAVTGHDPAR